MHKVAIGCDPNATGLKEIIKEHLVELGIDFKDYGSNDPIYANVAFEIGEAVAHGKHDSGILICGTGIGMCIAANKVTGAYAALCSDIHSAIRARKSNNSNILALGAFVLEPTLAKRIVSKWLETEYIPGGRSAPKLQRIYEYERHITTDTLEKMMDKLSTGEEIQLKRIALNIRKKILRMIKAGKEGHVGGAMSSVEIVTALYFHLMDSDPQNPLWRERDRFVLSAGHKCLVLYAALAEKGYFDESILDTYGELGSKIPGHPDMHKLPGVETNTGALGHGLSIAGGMALGLKMNGLDSRVYVLMGDGEIEEGSNWEAAAACSHYKLDNLLAFVDRNYLQISGPTAEVMNYEPLKGRWEAFGWSVREVDGHDLSEIIENVNQIPFIDGKPSVILANTVKGKGVSFAEDQVGYHFWKATPEQMDIAEKDLERVERELVS